MATGGDGWRHHVLTGNRRRVVLKGKKDVEEKCQCRGDNKWTLGRRKRLDKKVICQVDQSFFSKVTIIAIESCFLLPPDIGGDIPYHEEKD